MKETTPLGLDQNGVQKVMRGKDYAMDSFGQLGLSIMSNIVAQLAYFYTDKVGVAVGALGIVMGIAKVIDALTDVFVGNYLEHTKGNSKKYYRWMIKMAIPAAAVMILLFTVPSGTDVVQLGYVLLTNVAFTAVLYTMIAIPFGSVQILRTESAQERANMGIFRAIGSYAAGIVITMLTIPITNALGGTKTSWVIYGVILAIAMLASFFVCYRNGKNAVMVADSSILPEAQEEKTPFKEAFRMLMKNKYWVMVLLYNVIVGVGGGISSTATAYYCKWIFGNDNLVAMLGAAGMIGTVIGFLISSPMLKKFGARNTILICLAGSALFPAIRCLAPANMPMYMVTGALGGCMQLPLMTLFGVITGYSVDYNEYKYGKRLVAVSSGAGSFGGKVGTGLASVILSACLSLGAYDASLAVATGSMRMGIYAYANIVPIVLNLALLFIFLGFDIEKKLPEMRAEIEERKA